MKPVMLVAAVTYRFCVSLPKSVRDGEFLDGGAESSLTLAIIH